MNPHEIFFTSDTHFGHEAIIEHDRGRWPLGAQFANIKEHDDYIVEKWNEVVRPTDTVYHLGDFAFRCALPVYEYRRRLNGRIVLVPGNHDPGFAISKDRWLWQALYDESFRTDEQRPALTEVKVLGQRIVLCHYPMFRWNGSEKGVWHLHGHTHGNVKGPEGSLDVGFNVWGRPISYGEVAWHLRNFRSLPHHPHPLSDKQIEDEPMESMEPLIGGTPDTTPLPLEG